MFKLWYLVHKILIAYKIGIMALVATTPIECEISKMVCLGTEMVQISVSCTQLDPLGCHALQSGRFRMLAKWGTKRIKKISFSSFPIHFKVSNG